MRKLLSLLFLVSAVVSSAVAQDFSVKVSGDSTFNAAEENVKAQSGIDVDTSKLNVLHIGLQVIQDIGFAAADDKDIISNLNAKSYYWERADLMTAAALPGRTNMYFSVSFMQTAEGVSNDGVMKITNLEIEHYFKKNLKIRFGRLANSVSESQFYGRMAIEETSAHVYGRKIFIHDALELDGAFSRTGPKYFVGVKPVFSTLNFKGAYAGIVFPFQNGFKMHYIAALNRSFEADVSKYIPDFKGKEVYFSYEAEVAQRWKKTTAYLNVGGNVGYRGVLTHTSGRFDFIKQFRPTVTDRDDSFKETFTLSGGLRIFPAKMTRKMRLIQQAGLEAEIVGACSDKLTYITACAYMKMNLTKRLILTYYCTPEFIDQSFNPNKPSKVSGVVNFFRLSLMVGNPGRMYM